MTETNKTTEFTDMFRHILENAKAIPGGLSDAGIRGIDALIAALPQAAVQPDYFIKVLEDLQVIFEDNGHTLIIDENGPRVLPNGGWASDMAMKVYTNTEGAVTVTVDVASPANAGERQTVDYPIVLSDEHYVVLAELGKFYIAETYLQTVQSEIVHAAITELFNNEIS